MDLRESPEDLAFRAEVREFVAKNLPAEIRERVLGFRRVPREDYVTWQRILHAQGWAAPGWPVQYGGTGWNARQRSIFDEECYVGGAPRQLPFGLSMLGPVLMKFGTPEQLARYLPRILDLQDWWCQGYSEPGAGSDLASLKTRAERRGDVYVVNGQKTWTTLAHYANMFFCLVRTNAEGKPQQGISFLLIDMKTPGVRCGRSGRSTRARTSTRCSSTTSRCRSRTSSARNTAAGRSPSTCSATSAPTSPASACASAC